VDVLFIVFRTNLLYNTIMYESFDVDPFDARVAAQDQRTFQRYLELVKADARGDESARAARITRMAMVAAPAILKAAGFGEEDPTVPEKELSRDQVILAVNTLSATEDDFAAAKGLATFGESAGSDFALERALQRYQDISPTRELFETAWNNPNCKLEDALVYVKYGQLGRDIGMGFAKFGLHEQASTALRWTAENHNQQMAVNAIAYTLADTKYPDTIRWVLEEFLYTTEQSPDCNVEYFSDVLTEKYGELVVIGITPEDKALIQKVIQKIEIYMKNQNKSN
jgi:hypothetical protein